MSAVGTGSVIAIVSAVLTGITTSVAGYATAKTQGKSEIEKIKEGKKTDEIAIILSERKEQVKELSDQVALMRDEAREEKKRTDDRFALLEAAIDEITGKYTSAIFHIRSWRSRHPESIASIDIPRIIRSDVEDIDTGEDHVGG